MAMPKELRKYLSSIVKSEGFHVEHGRHIKLYHPDKRMPVIVVSNTPRGGFAVTNVKSQIERELRKIA